MNCVCIGLLLLISVLLKATIAQVHGPNVCSYRVPRSYSFTARVPYRAYQSYRTCCKNFLFCWEVCYSYRPVTRYREVVRYSTMYSTYYRCCSGWLKNRYGCQKPICNRPSCLHGTCIKPNTCQCNNGYESPSTGCRSDINECLSSNGGCDQVCNNYPGGHSCACRKGYTLQDSRRCLDVNECSLSSQICQCFDFANNPGCNATCQNTIGSYRCSCSSGYRLATIGKCTDINECLHHHKGGCAHFCTNTPGSFQCSCHIGYQLGSDGKSCLDINECSADNGGCQHTCRNSIGSFHCHCRPGHVLDANGRTCSNFDECASQHNGCEHICNNYEGSYFCSCHKGYQLRSDNKTCADVDECTKFHTGANTTLSKCTQNCHNVAGSYTCSCNVGYALAPDGWACNDVDECRTGSNSCQQTCINTLGSYICRCLPGYRLNADGKACDALPCIRHPPIINGKGTCFSEKTNHTCSFSCNPGFNLRGSHTRLCQANHTWSGLLPTCSRKHCAQLIPPNNGGVTLPCFTYYQATCDVACNGGYFATGPNERTCRAYGNNTMYWSNSATRCQEISVCAPSPCKHKGICGIVSKNRFICDCSGTGYQGDTCEQGIVFLPTYPIMQQDETYNFTISARPENDLKIKIFSDDNSVMLNASTLIFNALRRNAMFQMRSSSPGMKVVSYSLFGSDASSFKPPNSQIIYVQTPVPRLHKVISDNGSISQGCHDRELTTGERKKVDLKLHSTAPWSDHSGKVSTEGILLVDVAGSSLPASLVGSSIISNTLSNSAFDDFIIKHKNHSESSAKTSIKSQLERCISQKPSIDYLPDIVRMNAFSKTVADGANRNTPSWINLIPEQSMNTFAIQDFEAKLVQGKEIGKKYAKCGKILSGIEDQQQYYAYSTNQKMLLHVNDEDIDIGPDAKICIFRSASEDQTLIGFANASSILKTLQSSTGWDIKANGIQFKNTSGDSLYHIFGKFSTELNSDSAQIKIFVDGQMSFTVANGSEFSKDGITVTRSLFANGKILMYAVRNLTDLVENSTFVGDGNVNMTAAGNAQRYREISVFFKQREQGSTQTMINGNVHLEQKSNLTYKIVVKDSGGEITPVQNKTKSYDIYNEAHLLNMITGPTLNSISSTNPELRSLTQSIAINLHNAESDAFQVSMLANQSMGESILQPLLGLKNKVILAERQMQVLSLKHHKASASKSEFQDHVDRIKMSWQVPLERQKISRSIALQTVTTQGKICVERLCFSKTNLEILIDASPKVIEKQFGLTTTEKTSTAINGKVNKGVVLGGLVTLKRDDILLQIIKNDGQKEGYFNVSMVMYGRAIKATLRHTSGKLESSAITFLSDGSMSNISAVADISKVLNENEVVFDVKGKINSDAHLLKRLNNFLHEKVDAMSKEVSSRIANLHKSLQISEQHQNAASRNLAVKSAIYAADVAALREVEAAINRTKIEMKELKTNLISNIKQFDNTSINYTKVIEHCPPRVCLSKCVPGLIRSICYEDSYEHVVIQRCSLVNKTSTHKEFIKDALQRQYVAYNPKINCKTRCPPLTGFIKKIFGKRKRRETLGTKKRKVEGLAREKRGIASFGLRMLARQVLKKGTEGVFGLVGGGRAKLGAQIGSYLPGPFGIVGMIVGGVIGSAFGKCDKLCQTSFVPVLKSYIQYEAVQEWKTIKYKESECFDIPIRQKLGYKDEHECFRWSNCSESLTDVECLNDNKHYRRFRLFINDRIKGERQLAPAYAAYHRKSLYFEALDIERRKVIRKKENAYNSLSVARATFFKANYTHMQYKKALTNAHKLLANEIKMSKLVGSFGSDVISVPNVQFRYLQSSGVQAPRVIYLVMDIVQKDGKYYQVGSLYDFDNANQSIADAVHQVIQKASSLPPSRKRRATDANKQMETLVSVDDASKNASKIKCQEVDKNVLYLIEIVMIVNNSAAQFQEMQKVIKEAQVLEENRTKSTTDLVRNSDVCTSNVGDVGCNSQWLAGIYRNTTLTANSTPNVSLSWEAKRSKTFAKLQKFTDHSNFTKCGGALDCVELSIKSIFDMIDFENSYLSKIARAHVLEIQPRFSQIFENFSLNADQTYDLANNILESIKLSQVRNLFCDPPPVILKNLRQVVIVTQWNTSSLSLLVESKHELSFKWMKNGKEIPNQKSNNLVLSGNRQEVNGYYNCEVSNKFGKVTSSTARVEYQMMPTITRHPKGLTVTLKSPNTTITLMCNATGHPRPSIAWYFTPFNSSRETIVQGNETMLLINATNADQSGIYRCSASNSQGTVKSHGARVHVKSSVIAEFSSRISFVVRLKAMAHHTVRNDTNYTRNMTSDASNSTMVNGTLHGNATNSMSRNISSVMQPKLPESLKQNDTIALTEMLSKQMNISKSRIQKTDYSKYTETRAVVSFEVKMKNMDSMFQKLSDWTMMSEDIVMARKGLLVLPLWLYHLYNNMSSSFAIANVQTDVLADTMESTMNEATCPVGYSLNSNGFICESCIAGTKYLPGIGCQVCPKGTYQPQQKRMGCFSCKANYTTTSTGAVESRDCVPIERPTTRPTTIESTSTTMATNTLVISTLKETTGTTATGTKLIYKTTQMSQKAKHTTKSTAAPPTTAPPDVKPEKVEQSNTKTITIVVPVAVVVFLMIALIVGVLVIKRKRNRKAHASKRNPINFSNKAYDDEENEDINAENEDLKENEDLNAKSPQYNNQLYDHLGSSNLSKKKREIFDSKQ